MEVLHVLDKFGLGEGAGLKLMRQPILGGGEEHVLMALLTHRGERFSQQTSDNCRALAGPLQEAVFRLNLPFTVGQSIHARMMEEDAVGFVCLGADGAVIELNQRAYELAAKYRDVARVGPGRLFMETFVKRAVEATKGGRPWQLTHPTHTAMMRVRMSVMPKERFHLSRDLPVIKMDEWNFPPLEVGVFDCLTEREREIAMILVRTGLSNREIAAELEIEPDTVRTHVQNIHRKLKVRSRAELVALVNGSRN
jgi:DNA-binding CsgD family transcriptional regulator